MMNRTVVGFALALFCAPLACAQNVVKYHTTMDDVKYTTTARRRRSQSWLPETFSKRTQWMPSAMPLQKPGDTLALVKGDNPLSGPFYVETAEPGDTLAIEFLKMDVDSSQGVGAFAPGFGALNETFYTPMVHPPLPERIWFYPIDNAAGTATFHALDSNFSVKFPLHPFLGCIGVAPAGGEARSSVVPAEFGGNMDAPEASVGNTLYLPVNVRGALLYMGDGHAAMGDGEVAGTAVEVPLRVRHARFRD